MSYAVIATGGKQHKVVVGDKIRDENAPTLESAQSDLLRTMTAVGLEFVAAYYPTATSARFNIDLAGQSERVMLPIPVKAKGGAA